MANCSRIELSSTRQQLLLLLPSRTWKIDFEGPNPAPSSGKREREVFLSLNGRYQYQSKKATQNWSHTPSKAGQPCSLLKLPRSDKLELDNPTRKKVLERDTGTDHWVQKVEPNPSKPTILRRLPSGAPEGSANHGQALQKMSEQNESQLLASLWRSLSRALSLKRLRKPKPTPLKKLFHLNGQPWIWRVSRKQALFPSQGTFAIA
jgi:hypothetical protein